MGPTSEADSQNRAEPVISPANGSAHLRYGLSLISDKAIPTGYNKNRPKPTSLPSCESFSHSFKLMLTPSFVANNKSAAQLPTHGEYLSNQGSCQAGAK